MKKSAQIKEPQKLPGRSTDAYEQWLKFGGYHFEIIYHNPDDTLRYELSTKRGFEALGFSKENVELMFSCSSFKVEEVVAQCDAEDIVGSIFRRIAELTAKLSVLRLALRLKFSKKRLRRISTVEREIKILVAALYKNQRLLLLMTRLQNAPGYDKNKQQSKYYKLPLPFKRWRDTSEKGSEEELMLVPTIGMQHHFSYIKPLIKCTTLTDYSARLIPLWHLRRTG